MTSPRLGHFLATPALLVSILFCATALAQNAPTDVERFERSAEQIRRETASQVLRDVPPGQRPLFDFGGYLTFSYLSFDDSANDNHAYRGYDLVGYARLNFAEAHDVYVRGRMTYQDYNPGDSFEAQADHLEAHIEEAYYRFDLAAYDVARGRARSGNLQVKVGRQFETWGNGIVLSQYLDGARVELEHGPFSLSFLAAVTAHDLTVDFDTSRPSFESDTRRAFYGVMMSQQIGPHRPYAYAMLQRDQNDEGPADEDLLSTRYGYDSYYLGVGINGSLGDRIRYGAEFVYEGGQTRSSSFDSNTLAPVVQETDPICAYAGDIHVDYLFAGRRRSLLGAGILFASGDDDRGSSSTTFGGNAPGTTDHAFNALGFLNTGLAFAPAFSNLAVARVTASSYPFADVASLSQLQLGAEVFAFAKVDKHGPIAEASTDSAYLGWEPDLFLNWQVTDDVTLVMRYGIFFPGNGIPSNDVRQFFYAGLTYAF